MRKPLSLLAISYIIFYFPSGLLKSYLSQFLVNSGLSYGMAGIIVGCTFTIKILVNPTLTYISDHTNTTYLFKVSFSVVAAISVAALSVSQSVVLLTISTCVLMASRNFFQSTLESTATNTSQKMTRSGYGRVKFGGSLSVAVGTATLAGLSAANFSPDLIFISILCSSTFCFSAVMIATSKKTTEAKHPRTSSLTSQTPRRTILLMFAATALIIGLQGAYYSIGTPWLMLMGLSNSQIFIAWTIGFVAEALVFRYSTTSVTRHYENVIKIVAICIIFRAFLMWASPGMTQTAASFVMQGITFSIPHAAFIFSIRRYFSENYSATAISVYFAVAHGVGIAIISGVSGIMLERHTELAWALPAISGTIGCVFWMASHKVASEKKHN